MGRASRSPDFRLDVRNQCLLRDGEEVALRPKTFRVLRHLLEHADQLVTKEQLLEMVWPDSHVADVVLNVSIRELRKAFGDDPREPRFIRTLHRRGYRFIGSVAMIDAPSVERASSSRDLVPLPGRQAELVRLQTCLGKALLGKRQLVLITGENGIGKSTLIESFLTRIGEEAPIRIAHGQCQKLCGEGEAFMPVLQALERACREAESERLIQLLARQAPSWLLRMPSLLDDGQLEALRCTSGPTTERMLRELVGVLPAWTAEIPLVLILEDLHVCDGSTIDLLAALARCQEPARFLLIGTCLDPAELADRHPLKALRLKLRLRQQSVDLPLEGLEPPAVAGYLASKLPGGAKNAELVELLCQLTGGNPLYLETMVADLLDRGLLTKGQGQWRFAQGVEVVEVADSLRQMIAQRLGTLGSEDQRLLEVASVAGPAFAANVVASAVDQDVTEIEERYEGLARRRLFLRSHRLGGRRERRRATRYRFIRPLDQKVLYQRLTAARRARLHLRIGEALAASYGERADEIGAMLAMHFDRGGTAGRFEVTGFMGI